MRVEAILLLGVAVFFAIIGIIYALLPGHEDGGVLMLAGTVLLGFVPGSYYLWWSRRMKPRPEDREDATMEEGSGIIGSFPGSSIWPFVLGMGAFGVALSAVFGFWFLVPALLLAITAAIGVTAESRRGGNV